MTREVMRFEDDEAYVLDSNWHAVQGSRCTKVAAGLAGHSRFLGILILALVLEPVRWLTRWYRSTYFLVLMHIFPYNRAIWK